MIRGGLRRYADGGGVDDRIPQYQLDALRYPGAGVPNESLAQIEQGLPSVPQFADGGVVDPTKSEDPRVRAMAILNKRYHDEQTTKSAHQVSLDIMNNSGQIGYRPQVALRAYAGGWDKGEQAFPSTGDTPPLFAQQSATKYADGGPVEAPESGGGLTDWLKDHLAGIASGAAGVAGAVAPFVAPRAVNAALRPAMRAMAKPVMGIEATSSRALTSPEARARFNIARTDIPSQLRGQPTTEGQGAWMGDKGMEYNPLFMQEMPRSMGRIYDNPEVMRYAAQMGENMEQAATPVSRFVPNVRNISGGSNAAMLSDVDPEMIKRLGATIGNEGIVSHRPGNKALVMPFDDGPVDDLMSRVRGIPGFNGRPVRYGRSDPLTDRVLLTREPGYGDGLYSAMGARPPGPDYRSLESAVINHPMTRSGRSGMARLP